MIDRHKLDARQVGLSRADAIRLYVERQEKTVARGRAAAQLIIEALAIKVEAVDDDKN